MHTIRLRGPWQLEPIEQYVRRPDGRYERSTGGLPLSARATMPVDWSESLGPDFLGRVRYRRTFQKPTGLDRGERVWLVIEPPRSHAEVELNRKRLGEVCWGGPPARYDITDQLEDHNRLAIIVTHPALDESGSADDDSQSNLPGGLIGEVRLEIEE
jgi:hypothetical protein